MAFPVRGGLVMVLLASLGAVGFAEGDGIWIWMMGMFGRVWQTDQCYLMVNGAGARGLP